MRCKSFHCKHKIPTILVFLRRSAIFASNLERLEQGTFSESGNAALNESTTQSHRADTVPFTAGWFRRVIKLKKPWQTFQLSDYYILINVIGQDK